MPLFPLKKKQLLLAGLVTIGRRTMCYFHNRTACFGWIGENWAMTMLFRWRGKDSILLVGPVKTGSGRYRHFDGKTQSVVGLVKTRRRGCHYLYESTTFCWWEWWKMGEEDIVITTGKGKNTQHSLVGFFENWAKRMPLVLQKRQHSVVGWVKIGQRRCHYFHWKQHSVGGFGENWAKKMPLFPPKTQHSFGGTGKDRE